MKPISISLYFLILLITARLIKSKGSTKGVEDCKVLLSVHDISLLGLTFELCNDQDYNVIKKYAYTLLSQDFNHKRDLGSRIGGVSTLQDLQNLIHHRRDHNQYKFPAGDILSMNLKFIHYTSSASAIEMIDVGTNVNFITAIQTVEQLLEEQIEERKQLLKYDWEVDDKELLKLKHMYTLFELSLIRLDLTTHLKKHLSSGDKYFNNYSTLLTSLEYILPDPENSEKLKQTIFEHKNYPYLRDCLEAVGRYVAKMYPNPYPTHTPDKNDINTIIKAISEISYYLDNEFRAEQSEYHITLP
jgi:hypothetical protein